MFYFSMMRKQTENNIHCWAAMASKLLWQRRLFRFFLQLSPPPPPPPFSYYSSCRFLSVKASEIFGLFRHDNAHLPPHLSLSSKSFCSRSSNLLDESHGPTTIDYRYHLPFLCFFPFICSCFIPWNHLKKKKNLNFFNCGYCFWEKTEKLSDFSYFFIF